MSHIKIKNFKSIPLHKNLKNALPDLAKLKDDHDSFIAKNKNNFTVDLMVDDEQIRCFNFEYNNITYILKEIHPVSTYFYVAFKYYQEIQKIKLNIPANSKYLLDTEFNFAEYFMLSTAFITFTHTAIECMTNIIIETSDIQDYISKKEKKILSKIECQKNLDFAEKTKNALPHFFRKSFAKDFGHKYDSIRKIKAFRDNIIHTKAIHDKFDNKFRDLYISTIKFDYKLAFDHSVDFINYHIPNLIEICNCDEKKQ